MRQALNTTQTSHAITFQQKAFPLTDWPATIASALCAGKTALSIAAGVLIGTGAAMPAAIVTMVAIAADILDGVVFKASALHKVTDFRDRRRVTDALTDRILMAAVLTPLVLSGAISTLFYTLVVVREVATALVVGIPYVRDRTVYAPNAVARASLLLIGFVSIFAILDRAVPMLMYWTIGVTSVMGVVMYIVAPRRN